MSWRNRLMLVSMAVVATACSDVGAPTEPSVRDGADDARSATRPAQVAPSPNLVDVILAINADTGEFSTAIAALVAADLVDALAAEGDKTVFAPTDAAFARIGLNPDNIATLPRTFLQQLLLFHVAPGGLNSAAVVGSDRIAMLYGGSAQVRVEGGDVFLNNAQIIQVDVEATNGFIHVVDRVILRPAASPSIVDVVLQVNDQTGEFSTLLAAVIAADLVGPLSSQGGGTVFAPTDAAFAAIDLNAGNVGEIPRGALLNILGYHIAPRRLNAASVVASTQIRMANGQFTTISVQNGEPFINDARIIATDIPATNAIIHVIDGVLLPQ